MGIQEAVTFPRVHCESETLYADSRIHPDAVASSGRAGTVEVRSELFDGLAILPAPTGF